MLSARSLLALRWNHTYVTKKQKADLLCGSLQIGIKRDWQHLKNECRGTLLKYSIQESEEDKQLFLDCKGKAVFL